MSLRDRRTGWLKSCVEAHYSQRAGARLADLDQHRCCKELHSYKLEFGPWVVVVGHEETCLGPEDRSGYAAVSLRFVSRITS